MTALRALATRCICVAQTWAWRVSMPDSSRASATARMSMDAVTGSFLRAPGGSSRRVSVSFDEFAVRLCCFLWSSGQPPLGLMHVWDGLPAKKKAATPR